MMTSASGSPVTAAVSVPLEASSSTGAAAAAASSSGPPVCAAASDGSSGKSSSSNRSSSSAAAASAALRVSASSSAAALTGSHIPLARSRHTTPATEANLERVPTECSPFIRLDFLSANEAGDSVACGSNCKGPGRKPIDDFPFALPVGRIGHTPAHARQPVSAARGARETLLVALRAEVVGLSRRPRDERKRSSPSHATRRPG